MVLVKVLALMSELVLALVSELVLALMSELVLALMSELVSVPALVRRCTHRYNAPAAVHEFRRHT